MELDPEFSEDFVQQVGASPQTLSEWTAQDFSLIYVRYRPHLLNHARKFLDNESIVEEVVQDAFLYLMTALPELDSEVGVLRFLKWKTRLLCLDILRAQGANPTLKAAPLEDEQVSEEPGVSESLERADDAAIVRLALALLPPRQRRAIVSTIYEEKTNSEVAREMGLSENGFRQLLFRARKSFSTALTGQAETHGITVSEALSLASKRHRSKLASGAALAFVLIALVTPSLSQAPEFPVAGFTADTPLKNQQGYPSLPSESLLELELAPAKEGAFDRPASQIVAAGEHSENSIPLTKHSALDSEVSASFEEEALESENEEREMLRLMLAAEVRESPLSRLSVLNIESSSVLDGQAMRFEFSTGVTLVAQIANCPHVSGLPCGIYIEDTRKGQNLIWLAQTFAIVEETLAHEPNRTYELVATDFIVGDFGGQYGNAVVSNAPQDPTGYLKVRLVLDVDSIVRLESVEFIGT